MSHLLSLTAREEARTEGQNETWDALGGIREALRQGYMVLWFGESAKERRDEGAPSGNPSMFTL